MSEFLENISTTLNASCKHEYCITSLSLQILTQKRLTAFSQTPVMQSACMFLQQHEKEIISG